MLTYNTNSKTGPVCGGRAIQYLGGDIRNIYILLLQSLLTSRWGQDGDDY